MEYALVSTAAGLVVAIPSVIAYNYIVSRVEGFVLEIQTTSAEIVDLLLETKKPQILPLIMQFKTNYQEYSYT